MSATDLAALMAEAVEFAVRHVAGGGLPFVGVLADDRGRVGGFGVNEVMETGDPRAHAEIVAMRAAQRDGVDLRGLQLLATGEPCGLCYRFAFEAGIGAVHVAVDADTVAAHGFDYRDSYPAFGIDRDALTHLIHPLPVERGLEPFTRYTHQEGTPS